MKRGERDPLEWGRLQEKPCKDLKQALSQAQALGLPNLNELFFLYVHERNGTAIRVLTQMLGSWH
jgi:hypothetical protein